MAHTVVRHVTQWDNYHFNGPWPTKLLLDIDTDGNIVSKYARYNDAAQEVQRLIQDSVASNERFRAYGMSWSLSNIAHQKDRMLFNARLNIKFEISDDLLHPARSFKSENLFFIQCGTLVKEITEFIFKKGKSLKTCGASNGQTIAGAIATGVHGASLDVGSIQDYVVGLNLIVGPNPEDIVYIERQSAPALNEAFAAKINARVIRNDALFNAALVGLGSFGFVHGVVIEAEDRFLLKRYVRKLNPADAIALAESLDFANGRFNIPAELDSNGTAKRPFHYKLYINPYNEKEDFVSEIIYKHPYRDDYADPIPLIQKAIYKDLPSFIAAFAARYKRLIPAILTALAKEAFPSVDEDLEGTLGEIFWDTTQQGAAFGAGFAVDHTEASKALSVFKDTISKFGPIPGILSMRFVKKTEATLGFTRFPMNCVLEIDGVLWEGNQNMISLDDFLTRVVEAFKQAGIKFALHWGKNGPWSFPGLVDYMYGDLDDDWKNQRSSLLSKQMADLFSNDFLDTVKLSDYRVGLAPPA